MKRHLKPSLVVGALLIARVASAQEVQIGYQGLPYKAPEETQNGIQVSDGVLMHVGAGAEVGYDTNVFYNNQPVGSGIIRTSGFAEISNATRTGAVPSGLSFDARAGLQYRRYTSADVGSAYQNAFMPSAGLSLGTSVGPTVGLSFADAYLRMQDPPYNPGQAEIVRDNNQASAEVRWSPGGGRISGVFRYTNMVDIFENNNYSFADSLTQELMIDGSWKWLPKTAVFVQLRQGYVSYLNSEAAAAASVATKYSSFPLHAIAGLRGLITEKIAALAAVGYANSFYSCTLSTTNPNCVTTGGILGSTYANVELTYRPTMLSRAVLGWRSDFQNSVISTFYYEQQVYASLVQQLGGRAALDISGRYQRKNYQGYLSPGPGTPMVVPRVDNYFQVGATLDFFLRNWAYAGVGYSLGANESSYTLPAGPLGGSVNYVKNQVFARLGLTY